MLPSKFGYVRAWTRVWHLIEAPLSSVKPWRDAPVTTPVLCGRQLPRDMASWGLVCGSIGETMPVCKRCVRKALKRGAGG